MGGYIELVQTGHSRSSCTPLVDDTLGLATIAPDGLERLRFSNSSSTIDKSLSVARDSGTSLQMLLPGAISTSSLKLQLLSTGLHHVLEKDKAHFPTYRTYILRKLISNSC